MTDGKSLLIVSLFLNQQPSWNEDFEKTNRFNIIKGDDHFNLTILKIKSFRLSNVFLCSRVILQHWNGFRNQITCQR